MERLPNEDFLDDEEDLGDFLPEEPATANVPAMSNEAINEKYIKGDVRIVTEQARYPLNSVPAMIESGDYELNPEFQRRRRWDNVKKSRLIESFIMNVPIPPIFLYEDRFSHYEVMDGLQRMTTIHDFYRDRFQLEGLAEWSELNGRLYSQLPDQVRRGIDRRYLSSIILLQETAKEAEEAQRLKQLVFERINSGGSKLEPQEARNAIYNGPMNRLCLRLSRNPYLCRTWDIPEPTEEELSKSIASVELLQNPIYREMADVELVLRFFAYRPRLQDQRRALKDYFDDYLRKANQLPDNNLAQLADRFERTIRLAYETFGEHAFWMWRQRSGRWYWLSRATIAIYDPLMDVLSAYIDDAESVISRKEKLQEEIKHFYERHYKSFEGRSVNRSNIEERNRLLAEFVAGIVNSPTA